MILTIKKDLKYDPLKSNINQEKKKSGRAVRLPRENTSGALILTKVRRTCLCLKLVGRLNGRNTGKDVGATGWQSNLLVLDESEESRRWL